MFKTHVKNFISSLYSTWPGWFLYNNYQIFVLWRLLWTERPVQYFFAVIFFFFFLNTGCLVIGTSSARQWHRSGSHCSALPVCYACIWWNGVPSNLIYHSTLTSAKAQHAIVCKHLNRLLSRGDVLRFSLVCNGSCDIVCIMASAVSFYLCAASPVYCVSKYPKLIHNWKFCVWKAEACLRRFRCSHIGCYYMSRNNFELLVGTML